MPTEAQIILGAHPVRAPFYPASCQRAWKLLAAHLSPDQLRSLLERGYFWAGGDLRNPNKYVMTGDGSIYRPPNTSYCVRGLEPPSGYSVPTADTLLACLLRIRYDEREFLKKANDRHDTAASKFKP